MKYLLFLCLLVNFLHFPVLAQDNPVDEIQADQIQTPASSEKNPWLAAGFSLILPGTGQMYVEERIWPEVLITAGMLVALSGFVIVDQQRTASIKERTINNTPQRLADVHWDVLMLVFQIAIPSLWLWNTGDAFSRAENFEEKVTQELKRISNAYIIEENLLSVTLWQF